MMKENEEKNVSKKTSLSSENDDKENKKNSNISNIVHNY